jgi:16S rRNA C967 or C1407 C5-methylase (RsmB/RsmF family)
LAISFPSGFEKMLTASLPAAEISPLLQSLQGTSHSCVRMNSLKNTTLNADKILNKIPFCADAFLLKERAEFVADPAFHAGAYYVQEASSTIIGTMVSRLLSMLSPDATLLDLCAAPGGKSTHIAASMRSGDILVANEVIQSRTPILYENLAKWGAGNHIITRADAVHFAKCNNTFDIIIADLPCSGEGLFRKDAASMEHWSEENVNLCSARQTRISSDIWPALKPGGFLIYSTCTFNYKENEENVQTMAKELDAEIMVFDLPESWNLFSQLPGCYRLLPHRSPGEGFFFAVLQKKGSANTETKREKLYKKNEFQIAETEIPLSESYTMYSRNDEIYALKTADTEHLFALLQKLPMLYAPGTLVGKTLQKRHKLQLKPEAPLALMADLKRGYYPEIAADNSDILRFLRRDHLANSHKNEGIHLFTWKGLPIGFANGLQHQWNHGWPMEWRIRKENLHISTILS